MSFKDLDLMLFDKVIVFDNFKQKIILIVNIKTENIEKEYEIGISRLNGLVELIKNDKSQINKEIIGKENNFKLKTEFKPLFSKKILKNGLKS